MDKYYKDEEEKDVHDLDSYMEQEIEENIEKEIEKRDNQRAHIPFSTENDEFLDMQQIPFRYQTWFENAKMQAAQISSTLSIELERLLKVKENERWQVERERGKIFTRQLASLAVDPGYRTPFKEKFAVDTKNVVVQIVMDLSGSMSGCQIKIAIESVIAMSMALQKLDIAHEIVGFNTHERKLQDESHNYDYDYYNRIDIYLKHYLFKDMNSRKLDALIHADNATNGTCNCDGESIRFFAKRIVDRKEKRKIMFVLSDGEPHINEGSVAILANDLSLTVKQIKQEGIEIIGIGIQTNAVKEFYDEYIIVNKLEDLAQESMRELKKILLK
jgi:cobaltochelatase CobT